MVNTMNRMIGWMAMAPVWIRIGIRDDNEDDGRADDDDDGRPDHDGYA